LCRFEQDRPEVLGHGPALHGRLKRALLALNSPAPTSCTAPRWPPMRWPAPMPGGGAPARRGRPADRHVAAIGAHGQTVRHRPAVRRHGLHLQLNNPALLAERTGITVGRLPQPRRGRRRPGRALVPAFHARLFGQAAKRSVLNLGGIANLTVSARRQPRRPCSASTAARQCADGPLVPAHTGQPYDETALGGPGRVDAELLAALLSEPFLASRPPRAPGATCSPRLAAAAPARPRPAQRHHGAGHADRIHRPSCAQAVLGQGQDSRRLLVRRRRAQQRPDATPAPALPGVSVESTAQAGLPPLQVEAAAFAWLARQACCGASPATWPA
jgi:anhydro-N-acetylmuramic acid kinase